MAIKNRGIEITRDEKIAFISILFNSKEYQALIKTEERITALVQYIEKNAQTFHDEWILKNK